jgi:hypothetical protein
MSQNPFVVCRWPSFVVMSGDGLDGVIAIRGEILVGPMRLDQGAKTCWAMYQAGDASL